MPLQISQLGNFSEQQVHEFEEAERDTLKDARRGGNTRGKAPQQSVSSRGTYWLPGQHWEHNTQPVHESQFMTPIVSRLCVCGLPKHTMAISDAM